MSHVFGHCRLPCYEKAVEFYALVVSLERKLGRHDACLTERLRVAAMSLPMRIAAGAGATRRSRKARSYGAALRVATQCSAILDLFAVTFKTDPGLQRGRVLLEEIALQVGALNLHVARDV